MKLYAENGEVFFDYFADYDRHECQDFIINTAAGWQDFAPHTKKMVCTKETWQTEYGNARKLLTYLGNAQVEAYYSNHIEIDESFDEYFAQIDAECERLRKIEEEKEKRRQEIAKWEETCKYGCGICKNKQRIEDDYICKATGDLLPERNVPQYRGKVYQLFNYEAFPTDNCPFNVNKNKEVENVQESTKKTG